MSLVIQQLVLLSHISSLRLSSGHLGPVLTLRTNYAACASLPSPHSLLYHLSASTCSLACILWVFFFLQFILPSEIPKLPTDMPVRWFPTMWKCLLLHDTLSRTVSIPKSFVSVSIFYILSYLLSKRLGCLSGYLVSSASIQKFFCESSQHSNYLLMNFLGRNWSPHSILPPSLDGSQILFLFAKKTNCKSS